MHNQLCILLEVDEYYDLAVVCVCPLFCAKGLIEPNELNTYTVRYHGNHFRNPFLGFKIGRMVHA